MGSIPGSGRSPGGHGSQLQHSCLENPMDRVTWQAAVHRVTKSQTRLHAHTQWFITLHEFHVYHVLFLLLHTLQQAHHQEYSFHPSLSRDPFTHLAPGRPLLRPFLSLVTSSLSSVSTCLCLVCSFIFCFFLFYIPPLGESQGIRLSPPDLFHLANTLVVHLSLCVTFHSVHIYTPQLLFFFFQLSCAACRILVARLGTKPGPLAVKLQSLNYWTTTEFPTISLPIIHQWTLRLS